MREATAEVVAAPCTGRIVRVEVFGKRPDGDVTALLRAIGRETGTEVEPRERASRAKWAFTIRERTPGAANGVDGAFTLGWILGRLGVNDEAVVEFWVEG